MSLVQIQINSLTVFTGAVEGPLNHILRSSTSLGRTLVSPAQASSSFGCAFVRLANLEQAGKIGLGIVGMVGLVVAKGGRL